MNPAQRVESLADGMVQLYIRARLRRACVAAGPQPRLYGGSMRDTWADVGAVWPAFEEALLDQGLEQRGAQQRVNAAETLHLRPGQSQSGHFEEFAAEAFEQ